MNRVRMTVGAEWGRRREERAWAKGQMWSNSVAYLRE